MSKHEILNDVLSEDYLKLVNGIIVKNLSELVDALEDMSEEDFNLHVYGDNNDFAEWILEAYWDEGLTSKVLGARSKKKLVKMLKSTLGKAEKKHKKIKAPKRKKEILSEIRKTG